MDFSQIKEDPLNEYRGLHLFVGSFPWLFPGGFGDITMNYESKMHRSHSSLERLMRYKDFRFERDKMFCFYANDHLQRKLANSNAGFLSNTFVVNALTLLMT